MMCAKVAFDFFQAFQIKCSRIARSIKPWVIRVIGFREGDTRDPPTFAIEASRMWDNKNMENGYYACNIGNSLIHK